MLQRVFHRYIFQFFGCTAPERSAGSRYQQPAHLFSGFSVKALEHSTVFAVHRQNPGAPLRGQRHDQMSRCNQRFFIGQGDIFPCLQGRHSGTYTDHPHNSGNQQLRFREHRCLQEPLHARRYPGVRVSHSFFQFLRLLFLPYGCETRLKFSYLPFQQIDIFSGADGAYPDISVFPHNIKCLCADGTRRPKDRYGSHTHSSPVLCLRGVGPSFRSEAEPDSK